MKTSFRLLKFSLAALIGISSFASLYAQAEDTTATRPENTNTEFQKRVVHEIREILSPEKIQLGDLKKILVDPDSEDSTSDSFFMYGNKQEEHVSIKCEQSAFLFIDYFGYGSGQIGAGICEKNYADLKNMMKSSLPRADQEIKKMSEMPGFEEARRKLGWVSEKRKLENGAELYYFPLIAIGHGLIAQPTAVLLKDKKVFLAQVEATNLCGDLERTSGLRLCSDTRKVLTELVQRLALLQ